MRVSAPGRAGLETRVVRCQVRLVVKDPTSAIGGAALLIAGTVMTLFVLANYQIGTPRQMGPGFFPMLVGCCLALFGLALLAFSLSAREVPEELAMRPMLSVLGSLFAFVVVTPLFGVVPSILAMVVIASFADDRLTIVKSLAVAAALVVMVILIFQVALGIPLRLFLWPF